MPWLCISCRASLRARSTHQLGSSIKEVTRYWSSRSKQLRISEEVEQALHEKKPIVALESTIYTHGFPYPDNLSLASRLESLVRVNGGVPATIGILDGIPRVGFGADELVRLVSSAGSKGILKVSRRDLGFACALSDADGRPFNGGTTVSGTMILAHLAGIKVFATGGLGGVHRGAETTMDISADLTELGRTPLAVISSGCKSFLDIPKTLEVLETQGVAVATFADGRKGAVDFPAFYTRDSGTRSPVVLEDEMAAARVIHALQALDLQSGMHFANPIPEEFSIPFEQMETSISQALQEAHHAGAVGAKSTPYILAKIKELTGNKSVAANRALVEGNVVRGTRVAVALRKLEIEEGDESVKTAQVPSSIIVGPGAKNFTSNGISASLAARVTPSTKERLSDTDETIHQPSSPSSAITSSSATIFVAGSLALDLSCDYISHDPSTAPTSATPALHTSNPAQIGQSLGGVGHNVARAAHFMGADVELCSVVGDDLAGRAALEGLSAVGMKTNGVKTVTIRSNPASQTARTAQYVAVNDANKDLVVAMADMSILKHEAISGILQDTWLPCLRAAQSLTHLVLDANWTEEHLAAWLQAVADTNPRRNTDVADKRQNIHVTFEPVSVAKAASLFRLPSSSSTSKSPRPTASHTHTLSTYPQPSISLSVPNIHELRALHAAASASGAFERADWWTIVNAFGIPSSGARSALTQATSSSLVDSGVPQMALQLLPFMPCIAVKMGAEGVLLVQIIGKGDDRLTDGVYAPFILSRCAEEEEKFNTAGVGGVYMRMFPTPEDVNKEDVVSVNGVGDTFAGAIVAGLAEAEKFRRDGSTDKAVHVEDLIDISQKAAALTLRSKESVSPEVRKLR